MKNIDNDGNPQDYPYENSKLFSTVNSSVVPFFQPIEDHKLNWRKEPRINQQNDEYIERMRQKRSKPLVCSQGIHWETIFFFSFADFSRETQMEYKNTEDWPS